MSHSDKDYQQEQIVNHGYTHKKFNRVYTHKKLRLCRKKREEQNKENELDRVKTDTPAKALFRPYALEANTPRRRRISICFESKQTLQSLSLTCESTKENYMPVMYTPQSSPLSLETAKDNSALSCEAVSENYLSHTCTSQSERATENYKLSTYIPQPSPLSCETAKENYGLPVYTRQSSPLSCESQSLQYSPQSPESGEKNYTPPICSPQYSPQTPESVEENHRPPKTAEENSKSPRYASQSSPLSYESTKENYTPTIYAKQPSPQHYEHLQTSAATKFISLPPPTSVECFNSYVLRLQRQRAALYMRYLSQYQQLPSITLQTPAGYPMGYPNVTAPIFNGY